MRRDASVPEAVSGRTGAWDVRHVVVADRDAHPSAANGLHGVARQLVREQRAAGHDARLILLTHRPASEPDAVPAIGASFRGRTIRLGARAVDAVLAGAGPQTIFHIHGGREPLLIGLAASMDRRGLPYGVTVHGRFSHVYDRSGACLKRSTALYLALAERRMLTRARFVQALSAAEAQILRRVAPASAIAVVGNGVYSSWLGRPPAPPAMREPSADYPHFAFCGRYAVHHKGLDLLLRGFALHRRAGGAGRLTTIGSGPAQAELQALAATLGIADAVSIGGPRFGPDRDAALAGFDYFVMPSRYEGLPLAALEAAAAGLPLLVTEETGLAAEIRLHGAGFPIERLSPEAVHAAFHQASTQPAEALAGQRLAAYRLALSIADWTKISGRLLELYSMDGGRQKSHPIAPSVTSK